MFSLRYNKVDGHIYSVMAGQLNELQDDEVEISLENYMFLVKEDSLNYNYYYNLVDKTITRILKEDMENIPESITLEDIQVDITKTKEVIINTEGTVMMTSEDALTIMEYQTALDEKLSKIITHLGL